jgi:hypothetical protein
MEAASSGLFWIFSFVVGIFVIFLSIAWLVFPFLMMSRLKLLRDELAKGNEISAAILRPIFRLMLRRSFSTHAKVLQLSSSVGQTWIQIKGKQQ